MNYIVLDLEYNQSYDFADGSVCTVEESCPFEIIQIGAVKLNSNYEYQSDFNVIIKPKIYEKVHPYVEKLTGLNDNVLNRGLEFTIAVKMFFDFIGSEKYVLCVWGSSDIKELWKNMVYYNYKYNYKLLKYINVQLTASKFLKHISGTSIGLKNAVINFEIDIDRNFHNALNDAYYTGKIFQLLKKQSFAVQNFNYNKVKSTKGKLEITNFGKLYGLLEKEAGRKLTAKEKKMFKNVYVMGRNKELDMLKNK